MSRAKHSAGKHFVPSGRSIGSYKGELERLAKRYPSLRGKVDRGLNQVEFCSMGIPRGRKVNGEQREFEVVVNKKRAAQAAASLLKSVRRSACLIELSRLEETERKRPLSLGNPIRERIDRDKARAVLFLERGQFEEALDMLRKVTKIIGWNSHLSKKKLENEVNQIFRHSKKIK